MDYIRRLSDQQLIDLAEQLAKEERRALADLLGCLLEIDRRGIPYGLGYSSLYGYCLKDLRLSEDQAFRRTRVARAANLYPEIFSYIDEGLLTLSALAELSPVLTPQNHGSLLAQAQGKSAREVQKLAAELSPRPDIADTVRAKPTPEIAPAPTIAPALPPSAAPMLAMTSDHIEPTAPERVQFSFSGSEELRGTLDRIRDLLWSKFPFARLEDLILEVAKDYLERHDPQRKLKLAQEKPPRLEDKRRVPQWVRDRVWARDKGRCAFVGEGGRRCEAVAGLELDHVIPWAKGGRSDDPGNVRLLCRAHNQAAARESFAA